MGIREQSGVKRSAVFLDRDGVINEAVIENGKPRPPRTSAEFRFVQGVKGSTLALSEAGFVLIVVTNQPDVARGNTKREEVDTIHQKIKSELGIDFIYCCFHDDKDNCECRKPKPGMLFTAANELDLDLRKSYMVGDRWRDIAAGAMAGCTTIFFDYGYEEESPRAPDLVAKEWGEVVDYILGRK